MDFDSFLVNFFFLLLFLDVSFFFFFFYKFFFVNIMTGVPKKKNLSCDVAVRRKEVRGSFMNGFAGASFCLLGVGMKGPASRKI